MFVFSILLCAEEGEISLFLTQVERSFFSVFFSGKRKEKKNACVCVCVIDSFDDDDVHVDVWLGMASIDLRSFCIRLDSLFFTVSRNDD